MPYNSVWMLPAGPGTVFWNVGINKTTRYRQVRGRARQLAA